MGLPYNKEEISKAISSLVKVMEWDFKLHVQQIPLEIKVEFLDPYKREGVYRTSSNKLIAGFTLAEQKNCCGILVSTRTFVSKEYQGQGIAQEMMPIKETIARELNYSLIFATVNMTGNPAEVHILEKFGWKLKDKFINSKTTNEVGIFTKNLTEKK
jgi:GNAT superfamily N-acetyltransferase